MAIITAMVVKNDSSEPLSQLVRRMRKQAGLSQNELAELAGVGKTLIFDLEKGHEQIRFDNLAKILKVLNIKISFIPPVLPMATNSKPARKKSR